MLCSPTAPQGESRIDRSRLRARESARRDMRGISDSTPGRRTAIRRALSSGETELGAVRPPRSATGVCALTGCPRTYCCARRCAIPNVPRRGPGLALASFAPHDTRQRWIRRTPGRLRRVAHAFPKPVPPQYVDEPLDARGSSSDATCTTECSHVFQPLADLYRMTSGREAIVTAAGAEKGTSALRRIMRVCRCLGGCPGCEYRLEGGAGS